MTGQQLLGNDGAGGCSEDSGGPVESKELDQSLSIVCVSLQALLEVLFAIEKALRAAAAIPTHDGEVSGEVSGGGVEDTATALSTGYEKKKGTFRTEGLIVQNGAGDVEVRHGGYERWRIEGIKRRNISSILLAVVTP